VDGHRYRWGGLAWLLTLQFFVVEAVAAARFDGYSYSRNVISDLGTALSPSRSLMNASFVVQGLLIAAGALLLTPTLSGAGARVARYLLVLAGLGVLVVGLVHSDHDETLHDIAAGVYFVAGAIGVIALAYGARPRSERLGTLLAVLGLVALVGTVFFGAAVFLFLGEGGMERVPGYALPIALAVAGAALWRQGDWTVRPADGTPSRQELREAERAERARRAAERDAALEAAAARAAEQRTGATAATAPPAGADAAPDEDDEPDDFDPEDPWASTRRR
jgi:hypothetical membrane protein